MTEADVEYRVAAESAKDAQEETARAVQATADRIAADVKAAVSSYKAERPLLAPVDKQVLTDTVAGQAVYIHKLESHLFTARAHLTRAVNVIVALEKRLDEVVTSSKARADERNTAVERLQREVTRLSSIIIDRDEDIARLQANLDAVLSSDKETRRKR